MNGDTIHVDAVRAAFVKAYGGGGYTHSDENQATADAFNEWFEHQIGEAYKRGYLDGALNYMNTQRIQNETE